MLNCIFNNPFFTVTFYPFAITRSKRSNMYQLCGSRWLLLEFFCNKMIIMILWVNFLNQALADLWLMSAWFLEIVFVRDVNMCLCVCPEAINYIHVILNLYNQLNKFVAFRNVTKLSMHGRGLCNKAHRNRNQSNKAMLAP